MTIGNLGLSVDSGSMVALVEHPERRASLVQFLRRLGLLTLACLAVPIAGAIGQAAPSAQAEPKAHAQLQGIQVSVQTTLNTATLSFVTPAAATATLELGTDRTYGLSVLDGSRTSHTIRVAGLKPATGYRYALGTTLANGRRQTVTGSFRTAPIGPATLSVASGKFLLNGVPFFPVIDTPYDCRQDSFVEHAVSLGADITRGNPGNSTTCDSTSSEVEALDASLRNSLWWYEPDATTRQQLSGLPELLGGSANVPEVIDAGALLGCGSGSGGIISSAGAYDALRRQTASKPVVYEFVITTMLDTRHPSCLDPVRLNALFWTTIAAGVQGVEYFTVVPGAYIGEYAVSAAMEKQAARLSGELATLQPALLAGEDVPVRTTKSSAVVTRAWRYGGVTYIVAVNTTSKAASTGFAVASLKDSLTAQVLWEGRGVRIKGGSLSDLFAPLAVHIYKVLPHR